jgi:hypothetical protein
MPKAHNSSKLLLSSQGCPPQLKAVHRTQLPIAAQSCPQQLKADHRAQLPTGHIYPTGHSYPQGTATHRAQLPTGHSYPQGTATPQDTATHRATGYVMFNCKPINWALRHVGVEMPAFKPALALPLVTRHITSTLLVLEAVSWGPGGVESGA